MANFKIDHFVFGANTLIEGSKTIKNILDEDLSKINTHETMGTHNRVISLGSSYLEVIALDPKNQNANNNTWFNLSDKIYRDFIWVGDVCQIIEKFIDVDCTDIWNIGTGKARSFMDIAKLYAEKHNAKVEEIPMPKELIGQYQYYTEANTDKLINTIGDYKFKTIEEYINAC